MKEVYSQKEIAKVLNVSRATIDRVMHNRGGIGEETTQRVKEYLEKINYKPNKVGQGLSKKLNKKITFIYHVPENEFFAEIHRGIDAALLEFGDFGFFVEIKFTDRNSEEQIQLIKSELNNGADAIVLSPFEPDKFVDVINDAAQSGIPIITFNNDVPTSNRMFYAGTDYYQSGRVAGELLGKIVKCGKIGILVGLGNEWQVSSRLGGFKDVMQDYTSIQLIEKKIDSLPRSHVSYQATLEMIEKGVDAIFPLQVGIRGMVRAKEEIQAKNLDIVVYDLRSTTRRNLENDNITAVISQDPYAQGYWPMKVLFDYYFEDKLPENKINYTDLDIIIKENVSNY